MAIELTIDRIAIDAPGAWAGDTEPFGRLLEQAIRQEIQSTVGGESLRDYSALRLEVAPITVHDVYDIQEVASEIARRIAQFVRQPPGQESQ